MERILNLLRTLAKGGAIVAGLAFFVGTVHASSDVAGKIKAERYKPALGITPDGCQVWMIDDGWEGYAWNRTDRDGKPICVKVQTCFKSDADALFATDSARLRPGVRKKLMSVFRQKGVYSYAINGYTDSRASMEYNLKLGKRRATAVAKVARDAGARVAAVRSYGETLPVGSNRTASGRHANRRVEIACYRDLGGY